MATRFSKRLTAIIRPTAPGINDKGFATVNVCGLEVDMNAYFRILELSESGKSVDAIVKYIINSPDASFPDTRTNFNQLVQHILQNYLLAHASNRSRPAHHVRDSVAGLQTRPRMSTTLRPLHQVTTYLSKSDPDLKSPTSPEKEEQRLVAEAMKLVAEREAMDKAMPESPEKAQVAAALNEQLRSSLRRHQAVDDTAQIMLSFNKQNLS